MLQLNNSILTLDQAAGSRRIKGFGDVRGDVKKPRWFDGVLRAMTKSTAACFPRLVVSSVGSDYSRDKREYMMV